MAKLIIDLSCKGGIAPRYYGDRYSSVSHPELRIIGRDDQYADGFVNPISKVGYLRPANNSAKDLTGATPTAYIASTIVDTENTDGYFWERGENLYKIDSYTDTGLTSVRTVSGATGTDLEIYTVNGVRKLFYAYRKTGGGNIGIYDFSSTYDDTWLSATCSGGSTLGATTNTRMIVADNGYMYVLDGASVHKIDGTTDGGTNGTATMNVLTFPASFQLIDALDLRGKLWIALMRNNRDIYYGDNVSLVSVPSGVYVWDRQSTTVNMTDFIPIEGIREVRCIFSFRGVPACFTVSSDRYTQLRIFNGRSFEVVRELGPTDYPRFPDSIHLTAGGISWLANNGTFYYYGKILPQLEDGLYKIGELTFGGTSITGHAILGINSQESGISGGNTTGEAYYIFISGYFDGNFERKGKKWYPHINGLSSLTIYPHSGTIYTMVKALPKLSTVKGITLFCPPIDTSGTGKLVDIDVYFNQSTSSWGTITFTRDDAARGYKYFPVGQRGVNFIQLGFTYSSSISLSYCPTFSYAEVEYEPTTKKI